MSTAPSTEYGLISLADAKEYLGSTGSTDNDSKICDVINSVSMRFNAEVGRVLKANDYTEYYDGNSSSSLLLNNWPLSSTSITITIDADRAFTSTDDQVTSTDIMLDTGVGEVRLDGHSFTRGRQNVKVEYSAGFSTATAHDLTMAAKELSKVSWKRLEGKNDPDISNEAYEGMSRTYINDLPWSVKRVLDLYRGPRGI